MRFDVVERPNVAGKRAELLVAFENTDDIQDFAMMLAMRKAINIEEVYEVEYERMRERLEDVLARIKERDEDG